MVQNSAQSIHTLSHYICNNVFHTNSASFGHIFSALLFPFAGIECRGELEADSISIKGCWIETAVPSQSVTLSKTLVMVVADCGGGGLVVGFNSSSCTSLPPLPWAPIEDLLQKLPGFIESGLLCWLLLLVVIKGPLTIATFSDQKWLCQASKPQDTAPQWLHSSHGNKW